MKFQQTGIILACLVPLLVSCMGMPGEKPGPVPPRIVEGKDGGIWDNPSSFGQVPPELQAEGDATCRRNDFKRAAGYHPDALDQNGNRFPAGGYFCVGRVEKSDRSN